MSRVLAAMLVSFSFGVPPAIAGTICGDSDFDTIDDCSDNCSDTPNPAQDDTDGDDCGNLCDADYDNDGVVGFLDFGQYTVAFGGSDDLEKDHTEPVTGPIGFISFGFSQPISAAPPVHPARRPAHRPARNHRGTGLVSGSVQ